jgi:RNA recognition motif-containing protein
VTGRCDLPEAGTVHEDNARDRIDMMKKLYVGNLPFAVDDEALRQMFEEHGQVTSANVITDRDTGRSRGFGFVEISGDDDADAAIKAMDGHAIEGRPLKVNEARPREDRRPRGGGGGGGYGRDRGGW